MTRKPYLQAWRCGFLIVRTCLFGDVVFGGICKRHKAK